MGTAQASLANRALDGFAKEILIIFSRPRRVYMTSLVWEESERV